jgi:hypothetical protein
MPPPGPARENHAAQTSRLPASFIGEAGKQTMARLTRNQRLREVETIQVHHLVPSRDKVVNKFLLRVGASVNFRQRAENGV